MESVDLGFCFCIIVHILYHWVFFHFDTRVASLLLHFDRGLVFYVPSKNSFVEVQYKFVILFLQVNPLDLTGFTSNMRYFPMISPNSLKIPRAFEQTIRI